MSRPTDENTADHELVAGLRRGDSAAIDALFAREHGRVLSYLSRMLGKRDLAEDLLQETFLRLVKHAHRLAEDTHIELWLLAVARNLCISHFRGARNERARNAQLETTQPAGGPSPHSALEGKELELRLEVALARLSFEHREVLILLAVEGLAQASAATLLGLSHEALRQRYSRARKRLARELDTLPSIRSCLPKVVRDAG